MSQITIHILDTSKGTPVSGVGATLQKRGGNDAWLTIANGFTNGDGRIADLLPTEKTLAPGVYRMIFETLPYFEKQNVKSFYPEVNIIFEVTDNSHYHIPLLISPFGYSTYRGS